MKKFKKVALGLISISVLLSLMSFPLHNVEYVIESSKIKKDIKIVQLSDLHNCYYGKNMKNLIKKIDKVNPDIIFLTGDIFDENYDNKNSLCLLKDIGKKYTCYMIAGNHEDLCSDWLLNKEIIEGYGIHVLESEKIDVDGISVYGAAKSVNKITNTEISFDESLAKSKNIMNSDSFNILLSHYPAKIKEYQNLNCFDLILTGHAHGGQWRVPFLINGLYAPTEGLFPKYAGGRYDFDNFTLIVNRGLSRTKHIVPRIFNNPEVVVITLKGV